MSISRRQFISIAGAGIASMVTPERGFRSGPISLDDPPAENLKQ
jgi:hypothetical protein